MPEAYSAFVDAHSALLGLGVLTVMLIGFLLERFPPVVVATAGVGLMLLLGFADSDTILAAFANPAPIAIAALFVVSGALIRTGAIEALAGVITRRAEKKPRSVVIEVLTGTLGAAAFVNNTPVVIIMVPVMRRLARTLQVASTRLLIPLSYMAILGGTLTLIGTSTNLLVDGVAQEMGLPAFGIFEITPIGLVSSLVGAVTLAVLGRWLLPDRPDRDIEESEDSRSLSELTAAGDCRYLGLRLAEIPSLRAPRVKVLGIKRDGETLRRGLDDVVLVAGDRLIVTTTPHELAALASGTDFMVGIGGLRGGAALSVEQRPSDVTLVEATIGPTHPSLGHRLAEIPMLSRLPIRVLGLSRYRHTPGPDLPNARLRVADTVLIATGERELATLRENATLLGVAATRARPFRRDKAPVAIGALMAVILLAAFDVLPIAVAAILAVGLILLTRCVDPDEAWGSIDGDVLVLIFAMLAVGLALQEAGSVDLLIRTVAPLLEQAPPFVLILAVYALTSVLTEMVTNNAVAVILAPLVIGLAERLGIDPRPLLMAVMFGASASFATPVGYQTNTIVYAAGNYRFVDFLRIGVPMNVIVGLATCMAIYLMA